MFQRTPKPLPMALWERVKHGQDIGVDTSKDLICPSCWSLHKYTKLAIVTIEGEVQYYNCPEHGKVNGIPEYSIESDPKFHGLYEQKLIERKAMSNSLVVQQASPLMVQQAELTRMKGVVRAGLFNIPDLGDSTEMVIELVAQAALMHGLNPVTGEVFPYIERKGDKIVKVSVGINYKGLARSARRKSEFTINEAEIRVLDPETIRAKKLNQVPNWKHFTDRSQPPTIEFKPEECIAVEVPLYRHDVYEKALELAERGKRLGVSKTFPVGPTAVGLGVWRPGDTIPAGRTSEWRAILRGIKDAINKAYDLDFALVSMVVDKADVQAEMNRPYVVEFEEGDVIDGVSFTVDDILSEQPDIVKKAMPGDSLDDKGIAFLKKQLSKIGVSFETVLTDVFPSLTEKDLTKIAARNMITLVTIKKEVYAGKPISDFFPDAPTVNELAVLGNWLNQRCYDDTYKGVTWTTV